MKKLIIDIGHLIPSVKRKKLPFFFFISIINSFLDFISIALLTPFILLVINKEKIDTFLVTNFSITYERQHIIAALIILIVFYLSKNLLQTRIIFVQSKYLYSIGSILSKKLANTFINGSYENFYLYDKGKLIQDLHKLPMIFITNVLLPLYNLLSETIILLMIVIVGTYLNAYVTFFSIIFVLSCSSILFFLRKNKTKHFNETISSSYRITLNNLMNILNGFIEIKSSESENKFIEKFSHSNKEYNDTMAELTTFKQNNIRYLEVLTICFIAFSIVFILLNSWSFKDMVLLSFYGSAIIKIIPSFNKIINAYVDIRSNKHAVDILTLYQFKNSISKSIIPFKDLISLKELYFNYPDKEIIINNINLEIKKGDFIAITGKSGCGKTTLLYIISGLLPPTSGNILIDGKIKQKNSFLPFVYLVSQQSFIFQGTLLDNIIMTKTENIDLKYINELIDALDLRKWLNSLPNGLRTNLVLDSRSISGGQKQRIALARALYTKPKILLLDEATNQLNEALERKIMNFLKKKVINKELTIISVFHNSDLLDYATKYFTFKDHKLSQ